MTKKANLPIKQHYVPQWLLYNFVKRYDQEGQIWCHDLSTDKSFQQAPRGVGFVKDLYTLEQPHASKDELYAIETQANSIFDTNGPRIVNAIRKTNKLPSSDEDYGMLISVIAWQAFRTPAAMDGITDGTNKAYRAYFDEMRSRPDLFEEAKAGLLADTEDAEDRTALEKMTLEDFARITAPERTKLNIPKNHVIQSFMNFSANLADRFAKRSWKILVAKGDEKFVIGDNPVQPIAMNGYGSLASPDSFIVMPITQRLALAGVVAGRFGFKDYNELPRSKVALINRVMVGNAQRWIFSTEKTFYHQDGSGRVENSDAFFGWRKKLEAEAKTAGRSLHVKTLPDSYFAAHARHSMPRKPN